MIMFVVQLAVCGTDILFRFTYCSFSIFCFGFSYCACLWFSIKTHCSVWF